MMAGMEDDQERKTDPSEPKEEDPVADLKRGVSLLFRAAKNAAHAAKEKPKDKVEKAFKTSVDELHKALDRLQSDKLEGALKTSLQEIGRAFGNVAQTLEREMTRPDEHENKDKKE
jgi:hypothetical protein